MGCGRKYVLPIALGFLGMVLCHVLILVGFMNGASYPKYFPAYPVVFGIMVAILSLTNPSLWLSDALLIGALPSLYWYFLLFTRRQCPRKSQRIYSRRR